MNKIPFLYDDLWKQHEIEYKIFNGYTFIKDLSYNKQHIKSIILLFKFNDEYVLRGYGNGILLPFITNLNQTNILNIHLKNKKQRLKELYDYIIQICKQYDIKNTKIYQFPYYSYILNHNLLNLIDLPSKSILEQCFYIDQKHIHDDPSIFMNKRIRNTLNQYNSKKICLNIKINIYFGDIPNNIFQKFVNKHFTLAEKKTKSDKCWDILKQFIHEEKAILLEGDNNFIYYFVSENFCYYGINACDRKNALCSILLYEGIKWIINNGYNFIYFDHYQNHYDTEKLINISKYKYNLCNNLFNNYYLEI